MKDYYVSVCSCYEAGRNPMCPVHGTSPPVTITTTSPPLVLRHACGGDIDRLYPPGTMFEDCPVCLPLVVGSKPTLCPVCGGSGMYTDYGAYQGTTSAGPFTRTCHGCNGKGWVK